MDSLVLEHISFAYKNTQVIKDFSLSIKQGSFTTLLGSSGCGKTTLLRLISGFLEPSEGLIKIDGVVQNGILPNKRKIGMVFQDYALFPHLTVEQNILYGLKIKKNINRDLVMNTAKALGIENLLKRYPDELSGGQQQRVALARSLVLEPKLLLMDEPLSSLDTNLRIKVREELKEIQQRFKITTLYVTHDQEEAFSLSDYIAIINEGKLIQTGTPQELYFKPDNMFSAGFAGRANFIKQENKTFLVRPEWISVKTEAEPDCKEAIIRKISFMGARTLITLDYNNFEIEAELSSLEKEQFLQGQKVYINFLRQQEIKD